MMGTLAAITCMLPQQTEAVAQHMMAGLLINNSTQPRETSGMMRESLLNMNCSFSKSIEYMFDGPYCQDKKSLNKIRPRTPKTRKKSRGLCQDFRTGKMDDA